jgi:hypothetical protein
VEYDIWILAPERSAREYIHTTGGHNKMGCHEGGLYIRREVTSEWNIKNREVTKSTNDWNNVRFQQVGLAQQDENDNERILYLEDKYDFEL